ncbi:MAG: GGDEF domain-containing protein [Pseudomonadota bacterium]
MNDAAGLFTKLGRITPGDLPSPPEVAIRVMRACANADITSRQLADLVSSDTVLVAELLRVANSPFFGIGREVNSVSQAVVVMGIRSLRNFVLGFSARESLRIGGLPGFDALSYWETVLHRAVSARLLAEMTGVDIDEAFTVGMLQDIGLLSLFLVFPEQAARWERLRGLNPDERHREEQASFGTTHDQVAALLCKSWGLPEELAFPIANHHGDFHDAASLAQLTITRIITCADWIAAVFAATDKRLALARCRKLLGDYFGFNGDTVDQLFAAVPAYVEEVAGALNLSLGPQPSFDEIVGRANRELIETAGQAQDRAPRLEYALAERERLAEELQLAYERLAQLAYYDSLTALVNRRRFDELFSAEIARHSRSGKSLSLVMLDLDHFKKINDSHGHPFGDAVLQSVSGVLKATLRSADVAARIGGEELCLLLPETTVEGGRIAAERVRHAIEKLLFPHERGEVRLTASFGGVTWRCEAQDLQSVRASLRKVPEIMAGIMDSADRMLYLSKKAGRNRLTWADDGLTKKPADPPPRGGRDKV